MEYCSNCRNLYDIGQKEIAGINRDCFICNTCGICTLIDPGKLLYIKIRERNYLTYDIGDVGHPDLKVNNPVLFRTKNYTCPNDKCKSRSDDSVKCAVFERFDYQTYKVYYTCCACGIQWT